MKIIRENLSTLVSILSDILQYTKQRDSNGVEEEEGGESDFKLVVNKVK